MGAYNEKPRGGARHYHGASTTPCYRETRGACASYIQDQGGEDAPLRAQRGTSRVLDYGTAVDEFVHADYNAEGTGGTAELAKFYQVLDALPEKQISAILDKNMDAKFAIAKQAPARHTSIGYVILILSMIAMLAYCYRAGWL